MDSAGTGLAWRDTTSCGEVGNFTGSVGVAACASSDAFGIGAFDTELRSPVFDLSTATSARLRFAVNYQSFAGTDRFDVDLSSDHGASWTPLLSLRDDHGLFRSTPGDTLDLDLTAWAGHGGLMIRFRYHDPEENAFDWYVQIDDVRLRCDEPPPCAVDALPDPTLDGGFESIPTESPWASFSTNFQAPLCTRPSCGFAGAHGGDGWAFLGGSAEGPELGGIEQTLTLPPSLLVISFELWIPAASGNGSDRLRVVVDGSEVFSASEADLIYSRRYSPVEVNLSSFADGGSHTLRFEAQTTGIPATTNFFVDDVGIFSCSQAGAVPEVSIADAELFEGDSGSVAAELVVRLSGRTHEEVRVDYRTLDGTAQAGLDYVATSGTLVVPIGDKEGRISIEILGEREAEDDETFVVELASPAGAVVLDDRSTVTILDDDTPPAISVADAATMEGNTGTAALRFPVRLSIPWSEPVTVDYATANGSATATEDYLAAAGTLVFPVGAVEREVVVEVIGDLVPEADETFFVTLASPHGGTLGRATAAGTIENDDAFAAVSIHDAEVSEGDAGTRDAVLTVTLSAPRADEVSVAFATADGSADSASDYVAASGRVVFAPGQVSRQVTVTVRGDSNLEGDETYFVDLTDPVNGVLDRARGVVMIRDDDGDKGKLLPRFIATVRGAIVFTGNTLGLSRGSGNIPGTRDSIGAFTSVDPTLQDGTYPPGTTADWRQSSSAAVLDLPAGGAVLYAELVWGGSYNLAGEDVRPFLEDGVTLITPAGAHTVVPAIETRATFPDPPFYDRSADVTELIRRGGAGTYVVGRVPGTQGNPSAPASSSAWPGRSTSSWRSRGSSGSASPRAPSPSASSSSRSGSESTSPWAPARPPCWQEDGAS